MRGSNSKDVKLGAITIGQSPRDDMVPEIEVVLGKGFEIIQCGALDDFNYEEIIDRFSPEEGEEVLVSKLRDGREVVFAERYIIPLLQECIDKLAAQGVDAILMLCTGRFPRFNYSGFIIKPQTVLHRLVSGLVGDKTLGLMVPDENQIDQIKRWWNESGIKVEVKAASPYQSLEKIKEKAKEFSTIDVEIIFLDCMGFTREMKEIVQVASGKNVILPRTMIAAVIRELLT
jgi:protein AroM